MKKRFLAMGVVAIMTASNLAMGFAIPNQQNDFIEQGPITGKGHPIPGVGPMENPKLLALLQVDENTLRAEREAGKTLVVIANEHGVSEQSLKELMIAERTQRIDEDVKEGRISAYQAQIIKADLEEHVVREINDPGPLSGKHRPRHGSSLPGPEKDHPIPGVGPMDNSKLLALLQVDENTLRVEREAGKVLVVIANEHGVSEQSLKELMIAERTQRIDEDVKEGRISAYQAQIIKADLEEHVVREINDPGPLPGKHRPGHGSPLPGTVEQKEPDND